MTPTPARLAFLAEEWREASATDASVQTAHPLAPQTLETSLLTTATDALAEASRRQTMRAAWPKWYQVVVDLSDTNLLADLGAVVKLTHPRFGLAGGKLFRVMGQLPDAKENTLTLTLWGGI